MNRALVWKEWRQLRALRWSGLALAVVLPGALLAGSVAVRQGWLPGRVSDDATRTILVEVLPATYALAVWPLLALLFVSQAFAGDRAAGVEGFLLERPVPRGRTWIARLGASLASTLAVAVATVAIAAFLAATQGPSPAEWVDRASQVGAGLLLTALSAVGALAAASVVPSPMTALLLGLLLAGTPVYLALSLWAKFPAAAYRGAPLGVAVSLLLPIALVLASWRAACRGEPAGRGRLARFVVILAGGIALALVAFFVLAPIVVRLDAGRMENVWLRPSPSSRVALVESGGSFFSSGWILDPSGGRLVRFLPPPVEHALFSPDGRLAVITRAGSFGGISSDELLRFFDAAGRRIGPTVRLPFYVFPTSVWSGSSVALAASRDRRTGLALVDPDSGVVRSLDFWRSWFTWTVVGPTADGRLYVALASEDTRAPVASDSKDPRPREFRPYGVYAIDLRAGRLESKPLLRDSGLAWRASRRLSPSGRYWMVDRDAGRCDVRPMLDLSTEREIGPELRAETVPSSYTSPGRLSWLAGDVLTWLETRGDSTWMLVARPGEEPTPIRQWRDAWVTLEPSPDSALVLVQARSAMSNPSAATRRCPPIPRASLDSNAASAPTGSVPETRIYDPAKTSWIELPRWDEAAEKPPFDRRRGWAGPRTLARTGPGFLALEEIDRPGDVRVVIGSGSAR